MDQSLHLKISYKSRITQNVFAFIMNIIIILLQKLHLDSSKKKKKNDKSNFISDLLKYYIQFPKKKMSNVNKRRKNEHCIFRQLTFFINKVRLQSDLFFRLFHIVNINIKRARRLAIFTLNKYIIIFITKYVSNTLIKKTLCQN